MKFVITVLSSSPTTTLIQLVVNLIMSKVELAKPDDYKMDSRVVNPYLCGALDEAISLP